MYIKTVTNYIKTELKNIEYWNSLENNMEILKDFKKI